MQLFVVGSPRSGLTIVTQFLNRHEDIKIFDEIDLVQIYRSGASVGGTLAAFLLEQGMYEAFRRRAEKTTDPALALHTIMSEIARPCSVWGEKNPRYAMRLEILRRSFPDAVVLFVLRDPRDVVNSCLVYRNSRVRAPVDFWIKDTVAEALALVDNCLEPLEGGDVELVVVRYEAFVARPKETLEAAFDGSGLRFSESAVPLAYPAPETVGDNQFFRHGALLPWKVGNFSPMCPAAVARDRIDADDPSWAQVDALARRFGYN